jgi:hypothetical protein
MMELPPFKAEHLDLPDRELGLHVWAWWIGAEAERANIPPGASLPIDGRFVELVRQKVLKIDTEHVASVALEKALKRLASGDMAGGGKLFRGWLKEWAQSRAAVDEVKTGRRRQRKIAQRPRSDALQELIIKIMIDDPGITQEGLSAALERRARQGVIEGIADNRIEFTGKNGRVHDAPVSGLKDRMSRARKKLRSR